jgi:hypothetical protein
MYLQPGLVGIWLNGEDLEKRIEYECDKQISENTKLL